MNILKYHFNKKFLHNRKQPWIVLTILAMTAASVFLYRPAYLWIATTVRNNFLLTITICILLFLKFLLSRMYYISCIKEGNTKARGCAGSSCLMTFVMAVCIVILTIKACRQHHKPDNPEQAVKELACSPVPDLSIDKKP